MALTDKSKLINCQTIYCLTRHSEDLSWNQEGKKFQIWRLFEHKYGCDALEPWCRAHQKRVCDWSKFAARVGSQWDDRSYSLAARVLNKERNDATVIYEAIFGQTLIFLRIFKCINIYKECNSTVQNFDLKKQAELSDQQEQLLELICKNEE